MKERKIYRTYGQDCVKTTMYTPVELEEKLEEKAAEVRMAKSQIILRLIEKFCNGEVSLK